MDDEEVETYGIRPVKFHPAELLIAGVTVARGIAASVKMGLEYLEMALLSDSVYRADNNDFKRDVGRAIESLPVDPPTQ